MTVKRTILKRVNPNNPYIKAYVDAIKRGRSAYHVLQQDRRWVVKQIGADRAALSRPTQREAVSGAFKIAKKRGGDVFVHGRDGLIKERRSF